MVLLHSFSHYLHWDQGHGIALPIYRVGFHTTTNPIYEIIAYMSRDLSPRRFWMVSS